MTVPEPEREQLKVQLFQERGETSRFIDAEINDDGNLVVSGQDVGEAPLHWWGDSDYEFWVTVASQHKDRVLLALLEQLYGGHFSAVDEFRSFLQSKGIPFGWMTWT